MMVSSTLPNVIVHGADVGFRFYKRSGNSKAWFNFSKSGISTSIKLSDNHTVNYRNGVKRTTINLGDGVKYVWQTNLHKNKNTVPSPMGDFTFSLLEWLFRIIGFGLVLFVVWVLI